MILVDASVWANYLHRDINSLAERHIALIDSRQLLSML
jgi:hypothetical protein